MKALHSGRFRESLCPCLLAGLFWLLNTQSCSHLKAQESLSERPAMPPQDGLVVRPPPPPVETFENDIDPEDGRPDGWYNDRGASLVSPGHDGNRCLRIENDKPGRPSRISRAFGVDGRKYRALQVSAWVRVQKIGNGEHQGEEPGILIDFLNEKLLTASRGVIGPWSSVTIGEDQWFYVSKRLPVKTSTRDAIMTVGLMGATGVLEIDSMELTLIPREVEPVSNLIPNSDFKSGDRKPDFWVIEGSAQRVAEGFQSPTSLELGRGTGRALVGLARMVSDVTRLKIKVETKPQGLRSSGSSGVVAGMFFVDERGLAIQGTGSQLAFRLGGTGNWTTREAIVEVPPEAVGAILQFDKIDAGGTLLIDDVVVTDLENPTNTRWKPGDVPLTDDSDSWPVFHPITGIEPESVLDTALWGLSQPKGPLSVKQGHLVDSQGNRARLWGVSLLPTSAFPEGAQVAAIAEKLYRMGVNHVRFGDLDFAFGPGRSLIDDIFEDTSELDPVAWARMDTFQAELAKRGLYYSFEMHSQRRFRLGDDIPEAGTMPSGAGPAAIFDDRITARIDDLSKKILNADRPVSGVKLALDPHLAWVTQMGEVSMLDLENGLFSPSERQRDVLKEKQKKIRASHVKRLHRTIETDRVSAFARMMRSEGLKSPVAGVGNWQRADDWLDTLAAPGLNVIEDRFYWPVQPWAQPLFRGSLFDSSRSVAALIHSKRKPELAYVIGQWCSQVNGGWALPTEAADILFGAYVARSLDVDALVRRGLALNPQNWGASATGTAGDRDIFALSESLTGMPQALAMMPHVASLLRRGRPKLPESQMTAKSSSRDRPAFGLPEVAGWEVADGLVQIQTDHTVGLAGRLEYATASQTYLGPIQVDTDMPVGVVVASSASGEPLSSTKRILITVMGRAIPTGLRYADHWQKEVAEFGEPSLRIEPVKASITWKGNGKIRVFAVDNNGKRGEEVEVTTTTENQAFELDSSFSGPHWELILSQ